ARQQVCESVLKSCIEELKLDLSDSEIKGHYEPGQEYEYYRDVATCLKLAQNEILIVDPYVNKEIFEVYADAIPRTVRFRLLSTNIPGDAENVARKYATGGNFELRLSGAIHDRLIFVDARGWVSGQSLKDAARKKPTYIVEMIDAAP